ncbi:hypothetical protein QNN03_38000 [Streptomyces sp. GXMU-J15]|uniref:Uncharacterized protein n=1 Tax=Streptomyces fuscus TaxID=3048495 RepID=A0ABT7JFC2_9ACTN|nr:MULTISPECIES: hypothetical protein [Streptomyces]MDL2082213.1 hypothetical protein [Streptomyces fuscus]SBT95482.1 hypothetical protein GA0115233_11396 [Streptomyces sp. DI166]
MTLRSSALAHTQVGGVQVVPNPAALNRLTVAVLAELRSEWQDFVR